MNASIPHDLFSPGRGARPPYLAGRETELAKLGKKIPRAGGKPPGRDIVLIGPRGNGKTALLGEFARLCRKAGADVVRRTPEKLRTEEDLIAWLLEPDPKRRETADLETADREEESWPDFLEPLAEFAERMWRKSARLRKSAIPGLISSHFKGMSETLREIALRHADLLIEYAAKSRPRVAIIDEAHTLDPKLARSLLNTAQNVNSEGGAPFLLVLAGTPQLPDALREANASFWSRCLPLGIGRISDEATREALEKPLAAYGVSFDSEALNAVVEDSQGYPYFIQMWGEALCGALAAAPLVRGDRTISLSTFDAARSNIEDDRTFYYEDRYREIEEDGLLPAAEAVARLFENRGGGDIRLLNKTIKRALIDAGAARNDREAFEKSAKLGDLGFLWQKPGETRREPGIPSLMTHILDISSKLDPEPEIAPAP